MGFQNENQLKVGVSVKATINGKVVEAKVIGIGFNRVTLRSEKGNEVSYAFNSEKFLKWFKHTPLSEVAKNHEKSGKKDILESLKIVTSGPTIKERTTTPKEKESRFKLDFDFADDNNAYFRIIAEAYANEKRSKRLGVLFAPMSYEGRGFQASLVIIHALSFMAELKHHTDAEWNAMIENRGEDDGFFNSFDEMLMGEVTLFCKVIETYAKKLKRPDGKGENGYGVTLEEWANLLPKNKNEALFVAQLLCDGGINKYGLSCAGLTENLLKDIEPAFGLATHAEVDEELAKLEKEGEIE
ncbi:hypothetical protein HpJP0108_14660 [Helicobacter pylori]|uniref:hypothetical protein n=1 Tax=Helicobacter pylori TaxID=210 RepID=UPI001AA241E3|nr:hypothetical protein [Helicobacter pylori]GHR83864.1 hypothetical protein JP0108_14610 [Helicobacter pylori]